MGGLTAGVSSWSTLGAGVTALVGKSHRMAWGWPRCVQSSGTVLSILGGRATTRAR